MHRLPLNQLRSQHRFGLAARVASTIITASAAALLVATSASAMSAPISTTDWVNLRPGPSVGSGNPLGATPPGATPDFNCWAQGQNINGVDVWFSVNYGGHTGFYASYYDNSSYSTDWQISSKYGIPHCGSAPPAAIPTPAPSPTPSATTVTEAAAINWARPYANAHNTSYNGLCLMFVFRAWAAAGVNLRPWVNVAIGSNTYPQDIWGHFTRGSSGGGQPPAGALVFFESRSGNRAYSHVALSVGGGTLVSTADGVANYTHYETVAQHSYEIYLGWWLPDR